MSVSFAVSMPVFLSCLFFYLFNLPGKILITYMQDVPFLYPLIIYLSVCLPNLCIYRNIFLSIHSSIYLPIHLSIYPFIYLSIYVSNYLSTYLSISAIYISIYQFIYLSICFSIYVPMYLSTHISYLSHQTSSPTTVHNFHLPKPQLTTNVAKTP